MKILKKEIIFLIFLTVSVFAVYGKSIFFNFVDLDDDILITSNINYISNIHNVPKFFITSCYYSDQYLYYRPVLNISFAIDAMILRADPKIYHFTNIILFILSIYLFYLFLLKLNIDRTILKFVCLLTAVHPIFASCVVWVLARNDTLLVVFIMLSFINFINFLEQNKIRYLFFYSLFFTVALFTKETALILLPVYVLFAYVFNYKITKKSFATNIVIFVPVLFIYFVLRKISVVNFCILKYLTNCHEYILNILNITATYIGKFVIADYIPVMLYNVRADIVTVLINAVVLVFLAVLIFKKIIDKKIIIFSLTWFIVCLLPTFLQFENVFLPHRFILPSLAIILLVSKFVKFFVDKYPVSKKYLYVLFFVLFATFSYSSYMQADKYKNSDVFWVNAYVDAPEYHAACAGLAKIYMKIGQTDKAENLIRKALNYKFSYRYLIALADILFMENDIDEAEKLYLQVLDNIKGSNEIIYRALSELYYRKKDFSKATEYAQKAYDLLPYNIDYSKNLAKMYEINGEYLKAANLYMGLLEFDKDNGEYKRKINFLHTKTDNKENINE
ncbi:MAG: glycosyltransferase family 39 protein [Endomicrobiaceae bacterium]|nr:glycosyltransferase family 39 protein [Endomicrobiaceae bacterium]